ncbi:MAG: hypothetical protein ACON5A_03820 [Candidatus Comchoanobacterales bacterium]
MKYLVTLMLVLGVNAQADMLDFFKETVSSLKTDVVNAEEETAQVVADVKNGESRGSW